MVVAIVYLIKTNPSLPTPIIKQYHSTVQVVQPPKRVLVDMEICNRVSGCRLVSGTCPNCVVEKVWEWRIQIYPTNYVLPVIEISLGERSGLKCGIM